MPRDTGLPRADAQGDFSRARRRRALARLSARLRRADDVNHILPFEEVVRALGRIGERRLGLELVPLDSIIGTVDRSREFDRDFRPTSPRVRERWQRINLAQRKGEAMPPIDVYRIGELHFVKDGHHRVSVARALGHKDIEAYVTDVQTQVGAGREIRLKDLPLKSHQRLFFERVPLPEEARTRIHLSDEWRYAALAEAVEAWGFRASQARNQELSRQEMAESWFRDEYEPVVEMLREAQLVPKGVSDTEAYMKVAHLRYLILRTHDWTDEVIDADPPRPRAPRARGRHDGQEASSRVEVAGCSPPASAPTAAGPPPSTIRLRPSSGSKSWSFVASTHSSASSPCFTAAAGSSRATMRPSPALGTSPPPASAASSRSSSDSIVSSVDTVKCAYSSEPMDSTTSILARNVEPRSFASPTSDASSKCSGRIPAISWRPFALAQAVVHLLRQPHVAERQLHRVALHGRRHEVHRRRADEAGDEEVHGGVVELHRRADLLQHARAHHGHAVAERHGLGLVVRHVDHRGAELLLQPRHLGAHLDAQLGVEVRERLVHQERRRVAHDRAAHGHALALAARELRRLAVEVGLEVEDAR